MSASSLQYYVLICDKKKKKKFTELLASNGGVCIDTVYGRGSAKAGAFAKALGFETEEHKAVLSCLIPTSNAKVLTEILKTDYDFNSKNTGFAFSVSLGGLSI